MEFNEIMSYLESKGSEQTRKIFKNHGAPDNFFGVKVGDLKVVQKKVKTNHKLAEELYATGNSDAQYLAGLIADAKAFTKQDFERWAKEAGWYMISEYSVAWNIADSPFCMEVCASWIDSKDSKLQETAWAALSSHVGVAPNDQLDLDYHKSLIQRIEKEIHSQENRVKQCMNGYVIALGCAVPELTDACIKAGKRIGKVDVYMGKTACQTPDIETYINKAASKNRIGMKKKFAKC